MHRLWMERLSSRLSLGQQEVGGVIRARRRGFGVLQLRLIIHSWEHGFCNHGQGNLSARTLPFGLWKAASARCKQFSQALVPFVEISRFAGSD